jgi:hypothetical protein
MCSFAIGSSSGELKIQGLFGIPSLARIMLLAHSEESLLCLGTSYAIFSCGSEFAFWFGPIGVVCAATSRFYSDLRQLSFDSPRL